jgi:hypothetical protein
VSHALTPAPARRRGYAAPTAPRRIAAAWLLFAIAVIVCAGVAPMLVR